MEASAWERLAARVRSILENFHRSNPLRSGMPREELKSRLGLDGRIFNAVLAIAVEQNVVADKGALLSLPDHKASLAPAQQIAVASLLARFDAAPHTPPSARECQEAIGSDVMEYLLDSGTLKQVSAEVVFEGETYRRMVARLEGVLQKQPTITVAQVRDLFATSRKYALAFMEHLDSVGLTVREGDNRRLAKE